MSDEMSMVDRAAMAIAWPHQDEKTRVELWEMLRDRDTIHAGGPGFFFGRDSYRERVREALKAIREPTQAMTGRAADLFPDDEFRTWPALIDEILR